jgi:hypothetical protein
MLKTTFRFALCALIALPCFAATGFWHQTENADVSGTALVKTGGCDGCADSCATSQEAITGTGGSVEVKATETDSNRFVGLTTNGGRFFGQVHRPTATAWQDLDYSLYFIIGGYVEVRERGTYRTDTTYKAGDVFRIAADTGSIRYYKNGELFYTSKVAPAFPLNVAALLMSKRGTVALPAVVAGGGK